VAQNFVCKRDGSDIFLAFVLSEAEEQPKNLAYSPIEFSDEMQTNIF